YDHSESLLWQIKKPPRASRRAAMLITAIADGRRACKREQRETRARTLAVVPPEVRIFPTDRRGRIFFPTPSLGHCWTKGRDPRWLIGCEIFLAGEQHRRRRAMMPGLIRTLPRDVSAIRPRSYLGFAARGSDRGGLRQDAVTRIASDHLPLKAAVLPPGSSGGKAFSRPAARLIGPGALDLQIVDYTGDAAGVLGDLRGARLLLGRLDHAIQRNHAVVGVHVDPGDAR